MMNPTVRALIEQVKPFRKEWILATISMIGVAIFTSQLTLLVKQILDDVLIQTKDNAFYRVSILLILFYTGKGVFSFLSSYLMTAIGLKIVRNLRNRLYNHMMYQSLSFFSAEKTGDLTARVISDTDRIQDAVSKALSDLVKETFTLIALLIVIFYLDWKLALISFTLFPLVVYPITRFSSRLRQASRKTQEGISRLSQILLESITGSRIVQAYQMEEREAKKFEQTSEKLLEQGLRSTRIVSFLSPFMELLSGFAAVLVMWYGSRQIQAGTLTAGDFTAFLSALFFMYTPIKKLSKSNQTIQQAVASYERIQAVLNRNERIVERPSAIELPRVTQSIEFMDVSFAYANEAVLSGIDFSVHAGEVVALVGPSGAGKSTLVNLLPRLYDVSGGQIIMDGHDIRDVSLKSLRSQIGLVSQEIILFDDTVAANIACGRPDAAPEEIEDAARAAYAHEFISLLPEGYEAEIGERGHRLSGGQRQRIALARAILRNPAILILDEATSELDAESEIAIQKALINVLKNRITFIVAHRLSTIRKADKIIVLEHGQIQEIGTHDDLLDSKGLYRKFHELQYGIIDL
ncbi:MAG TPA: ABC transporter ATP-binding protein [Acidobacteriota bacterium]|nr:ABC transporter ATP-binding protein [Acidobacteriota bacterium]